jgi:hypothetical protein
MQIEQREKAGCRGASQEEGADFERPKKPSEFDSLDYKRI